MVIENIEAALDRLEAAETAIDQLAALEEIKRIYEAAKADLVHAAIRESSATAVARVLGVSQQAVSKRFAIRRGTARPARPVVTGLPS